MTTTASRRGPALSLSRLRREGDAFMEEISREYYLSQSGQKATADLQPLYAKHAGILGDDAMALVLDELRGTEPESEAHRSARHLTDWIAESQSGRALASLDEREIAWEATAMVRPPDGPEVEYQRVSIELGNLPTPRERHALDRARAALVEAELAPLKRERLQREREITESLEIAPGYNATFELLSGVHLAALRDQCDTLLRETQAMWDDLLPHYLRTRLDMRPAEATRADALALFRFKEFDDAFPSASMESAVRRQVREMGIDSRADGRVRFDTGEREGKRSRAFCAPVRVPDEVYLVMRPHGGQSDWSTFLHELGHALHFAYMRPDLPFEHRWLGDNSITEGYAMLFDHLMQQRGWLTRYTELTPARTKDFLRAAGFEELHFLRRYSAKIAYEIEVYGGAHSWDALPDLYVDRLTSATTFRYDRADAFIDLDPHFYAARYLRAWQLQALIGETLVERFNEDWWRNPGAGPWIVNELFSEGQRELATEQAARVSGKEISFGPVIRAVERIVA